MISYDIRCNKCSANSLRIVVPHHAAVDPFHLDIPRTVWNLQIYKISRSTSDGMFCILTVGLYICSVPSPPVQMVCDVGRNTFWSSAEFHIYISNQTTTVILLYWQNVAIRSQHLQGLAISRGSCRLPIRLTTQTCGASTHCVARGDCQRHRGTVGRVHRHPPMLSACLAGNMIWINLAFWGFFVGLMRISYFLHLQFIYLVCFYIKYIIIVINQLYIINI